MVEAGLVGLDDQHVGGVLDADQPVGVLTLGVERVGSDHGVGEVQAVQQRPELGDLLRLAVHPPLRQHRPAAVGQRRQQVHRRGAVVAAAAQRCAIDRDRPARPGG